MSNYPDDPRLGNIITPGLDGDVVLIGFPCDEGVRRNGGRVGAARGPSEMRRLMPRMGTVVNPEWDVDLRTIKITDGGDIENDGRSLEEMHAALTERVSAVIARGGIPFVVGGGNDQSYPNACGFLAHHSTEADRAGFAVVNIDAHLDVRPLIGDQVHSGSPFRLLLEDGRFDGKNFIEFAAQGFQCSAQHVQYLQSKGGRVVWLRDVQANAAEQIDSLIHDRTHAFISFDLDSVASRDAPGVSAASPVGLSSEQALAICMAAGKNQRVSLFDLSEYNPEADAYRTGKLVVSMFYHFCLGVALRKRAATAQPTPA